MSKSSRNLITSQCQQVARPRHIWPARFQDPCREVLNLDLPRHLEPRPLGGKIDATDAGAD